MRIFLTILITLALLVGAGACTAPGPDPTPDPSEPPDEPDWDQWIVVVDTDVRSEPDVGADRLFFLTTGDRVTVTGVEQAGWIEVADARGSGWIRSQDIASPDHLDAVATERFHRELTAARDTGLDALPGVRHRYRQLFGLVPGGEAADAAYRDLLSLHGQLAGEAYARLFPDVSAYYVESGYDEAVLADPDRITDPDVRDTVRFLAECGYDILAREGMLEVAGSPEFLRSFIDYVSEPVAKYLELRAADVERPAAANGELQIEWNELARRAVRYDELALAHPRLPEAGDSRHRAEVFMTIYLRGMDNTPLFSWTDGRFDAELKDSYAWFVGEYPDSRFVLVVRQFKELLEQHQYRLTGEVKEYLQQPLPWQGVVDR